MIAFVQEGVTPEPRQAEFIREVQGWQGGLFRGGFTAPPELQMAVIRALHDHTLSNAVGPVDEAGLAQRAIALLPQEQRNGFAGSPLLNVAVAGGPTQQILRPTEMEDRALWDALALPLLCYRALFGDCL